MLISKGQNRSIVNDSQNDMTAAQSSFLNVTMTSDRRAHFYYVTLHNGHSQHIINHCETELVKFRQHLGLVERQGLAQNESRKT